jgi:hypothetical protein
MSASMPNGRLHGALRSADEESHIQESFLVLFEVKVPINLFSGASYCYCKQHRSIAFFVDAIEEAVVIAPPDFML